MLRQAFLNLALNACQAMRPGARSHPRECPADRRPGIDERFDDTGRGSPALPSDAIVPPVGIA